MKFNQFLQLISLFALIQSANFTVASANLARAGRLPARPSLKDGSGWGSKLQYAMNPQYNPYNPESEVPLAKLNSQLFNEIVVAPTESEMVSTQAVRPSQMQNLFNTVQKNSDYGRNYGTKYASTQWASLKPNTRWVQENLLQMNPSVAPEVDSWVSMNSSKMPALPTSESLMQAHLSNSDLIRFFKNQLLDKLSTLDNARFDLDPQAYHRNRIALLRSHQDFLNRFDNFVDLNDFKTRKSIGNLRDFIQSSLQYEEAILQKKLNEELRGYQALSGLQGYDQRDFDSGMPVQDPYRQVKQDVKGQFYRAGAAGAVGAGTLYGLKKYRTANNI
jgi:hypothetical protein